MSAKPKILIQLDPDRHPSVFDAVVAVDSGVDQLISHGGVDAEDVRSFVHGAIFTRGVEDLRRTAIFIGGADVGRGEALLAAAVQSFFGPLRVSVMLDANGANTTAAAAVLSAANHLELKGSEALVLAGTGPVGQRIARLLAGEGCRVRLASRRLERAEQVCREISERAPAAQLRPVETHDADQTAAALTGVPLVFAAGAAGVELLSSQLRAESPGLQVAIDLNAVPPLGIGGIEVADRATVRDQVTGYGAIGVGGLKMKIHKASIRSLFEANDQILDAEEIYALGKNLFAT